MNNHLKTLLFALFPALLFAQESEEVKLPEIIPPSPTVANLMHFEEVPVDLYTGQPDISVPVSSKSINQNLALSLALRYNTMGVRVTERSGWAGTGWSLDAGGVISRTVRGVADEQRKGSDPHEKSTGLFYLDDYWNYGNFSDTDPDKYEYAWNVLGTPYDNYDSKPDLFQFSMLGVSGRFILVKENGYMVVKQLNRDQKLKIEVSIDYGDIVTSTYVIRGFKVTDTNGYHYWFGYSSDYEETTETSSSSLSIPRDQSAGAAPVEARPFTVKSAWHLKNITIGNSGAVDNNNLARFYYVNSEESYELPTSTTYYDFHDATLWTIPMQNAYNHTQFRPKSTAVWTSLVTQTKKLQMIKFRDGTAYRFTLSDQGTHPENNGRYLEKIEYLHTTGPESNPSEEVLRVYDLNYEVTNTTDFEDGNERLWLMSLKEGFMGPVQRFSYYKKKALPRNEGSADPWGYNNGDYRAVLDSGYNYYNHDAIKHGLLSAITTPTGGVKEFNFGPNTFSYEGDNLITDYGTNPLNSTIQHLNHQFLVNDEGSITDPGVNITLTHRQYVLIDKNLTNTEAPKDIFAVWFQPTSGDAPPILIPMEDPSGLADIPAGTYICKVALKPSLNQADHKELGGYINLSYMRAIDQSESNYRFFLFGGGVRINSVVFKDPKDTSDPQKKVVSYYYSTRKNVYLPGFTDEVISSGAIDARVGSLVKEYVQNDLKLIFNHKDNVLLSFMPREVSYRVKTREPNMQLSKGNYVGYSNVTVYDGTVLLPPSGILSPPNGYTEYEFSTAKDWPSNPGTFEYPYMEAPNIDYKRGLLLSKTVYDKDKRVLEETENTQYDYIEDMVWEDTPVCYTQPCEWNQFYQTYEQYLTKNPPSFLRPICILIEGDCYGQQGYENCANVGDVGGVQVLLHDITAGRAELRETIKKEYFYTGSTPLVTTTKTTYDYNPENYQIAEQTNYMSEAGEAHEYTTQYEYPVGGYTTSLFTTAERSVIDNGMIDRNLINTPIVVSSYRDGELLQRRVNKYADFSNFPRLKEIATIKGNETAEDRVIYHNYDPYGNVLKVSKPGDIPIHYIWGYNYTLPVAKIEGETELSTSPVPTPEVSQIRAATHYETYSEANLAAALDELRNDFPDAMITSLVHKPGVGVKSVTDPRNQTVTYYYDEFGRLIMVKDNDGNLVSENAYRYRTN